MAIVTLNAKALAEVQTLTTALNAKMSKMESSALKNVHYRNMLKPVTVTTVMMLALDAQDLKTLFHPMVVQTVNISCSMEQLKDVC